MNVFSPVLQVTHLVSSVMALRCAAPVIRRCRWIRKLSMCMDTQAIHVHGSHDQTDTTVRSEHFFPFIHHYTGKHIVMDLSIHILSSKLQFYSNFYRSLVYIMSFLSVSLRMDQVRLKCRISCPDSVQTLLYQLVRD